MAFDDPAEWRFFVAAGVLFIFATVMAIFLSGRAEAGEEGLRGCRYFHIDPVASKANGAVGYVVSADRPQGWSGNSCYYDIRFNIDGQLVLVQKMRDHELMEVPEPEEKPVVTNNCPGPKPPALDPELDFGG